MNITEIKERLGKVNTEPWKYRSDYFDDLMECWIEGSSMNKHFLKGSPELKLAEDEGKFIENVRADITYLLSIIEQAENAFINIRNRGMENAEDSEYVDIADEALKAIRGDK